MTCRSRRRSARLRNALARLVSSNKYLTPRKLAQKLARAMPERTAPLAAPDGGIYPRLADRRDALRGARLLLCRAGRRARRARFGRGAGERPRRRHRADAGPCRHQEGQGLRAGGECRRQISRRGQVRRRLGRPGQGRPAGPPSYTSVFAKALAGEMARDEKVVAITAAMPSGTGLDKVAEQFPDRTFDVGIAEQHAVTFAGGLAAQGIQAVRGHLFDLPPARLRPGRPRHRDPEFAGALRDGPRRAGRRRRRDPRRARSTSLICARCPISS